jgi:hypothetical protein
VWEGIVDVVVKSLVCVDDVVPHQPNAFEVFGYDVLIDDALKPWLIEVNSSPSMDVDSAMDLATKSQLIFDTVGLVDPLPFDGAALAAVLERRLANAALLAKRGPSAASAASGLGSGGGLAAAHGMSAADRRQLDADLSAILHGRAPRAFGDMPRYVGNYQRICPGSTQFNRAMKLKFTHFRGGSGAGVASGGAAGARSAFAAAAAAAVAVGGFTSGAAGQAGAPTGARGPSSAGPRPPLYRATSTGAVGRPAGQGSAGGSGPPSASSMGAASSGLGDAPQRAAAGPVHRAASRERAH